MKERLEESGGGLLGMTGVVWNRGSRDQDKGCDEKGRCDVHGDCVFVTVMVYSRDVYKREGQDVDTWTPLECCYSEWVSQGDMLL